METMKHIIGTIVAVVLIGGLLLVLGSIIRFSILSPRRTKGARGRFRRPDVRGLEALCGFAPPPELVTFYKEAPMVERQEFTLLDPSQTPPKEWFVAEFFPLALVDTKEARKVSGAPGIPIGADIEKGTYFIDQTGAVKLFTPNVKGNVASVASSISEFAKFTVREESEEDEE